MTTDERRGLPSASGIERLSLCPGSFNLERTLPPLPETEDAASGTRIHRALELDNATGLSDEETWIYDRCREIRDDVLTQIFGTDEKLILTSEQRVWFSDRFSGKADIFAFGGRTAFIGDYKTGRGDVVAAEGNLQLRGIAAALQKSKGDQFDRIVVGIIQPRASQAVTLCEYSREDLARAREWLISVLDAADKPDAPRVPGEKQCRFCRAKGAFRPDGSPVCPESIRSAVASVEAFQSNEMSPKAVAYDLTSFALSRILDRISFAESVFDACRDEAKRRLTAGEEVPGWQLKPGAVREVIIDPQTVYERFIEKGGGSATFMPCVEVKKGKLKDQLKAVTGSKGKALDSELADVLAGCTEDHQNAPSLERVK